MTRRPVDVAVEDVTAGDIVLHAGAALRVHRTQERPTAGVAIVVQDRHRPERFRRLFYKYGETVEVLRAG